MALYKKLTKNNKKHNKKHNKNKHKTLKINAKKIKIISKSLSHIQKGGGNINIFETPNISTQPNEDTNYKEIGVVHITESEGINFIKNIGTGVANLFGRKGFDNSSYDKARDKALLKISKLIGNERKLCNLRMDIDISSKSNLVFVHLYGTLLEKRNSNRGDSDIRPLNREASEIRPSNKGNFKRIATKIQNAYRQNTY